MSAQRAGLTNAGSSDSRSVFAAPSGPGANHHRHRRRSAESEKETLRPDTRESQPPSLIPACSSDFRKRTLTLSTVAPVNAIASICGQSTPSAAVHNYRDVFCGFHRFLCLLPPPCQGGGSLAEYVTVILTGGTVADALTSHGASHFQAERYSVLRVAIARAFIRLRVDR